MSQAVATVSFLQGQTWAKSPDGSLRPLSVGSPLMADEILVTAEGARVELDTGDGQLLALQGGQEVAMSRDLHAATATTADEAFLSDASIQEALTILEQGGDLTTDLEETAAGNNGVGAGDGHGFVQLARIFTDNLDSPEINYQQATTYQSVFASFDSYSARNNPPQVVDQQLVFDEDTILTGQIIASDSENNTLTYTIATAPVNGVVRLDSSTGNFVFTPNENYFGQDSFVVTVTDSGGNSVNTNINLTINPINDAPVATNQDLSVAEDAQLTGQIGASDIDNDPLTYTLTTAPANGSLMLNPDGSFTYTPNTNYNGNDLFVVSISDGVGGITNSTINIAVTLVNDAPVAVNRQVSVAEDTQGAPLNIAAPTDIDGDTLTVRVSGLPGIGSITLADGTAVTPGQELTIQQLTSLRFNAPANVNAIETGLFQYTLSDGEVSVVASVTINVTPLNDAPVASNQNIVTDEDVAYSGKIMATDIDGDLLTYSIDRLPTHGTLALDSATGQFIYTPDANYNGSDLFSVIVNDGRGGIATSVVTVGVTPVNDAPLANNDLASTAINTPVTIDVRANDTDIDNARSELIVSNPQVDPAQGSVTVNAQGNLVFTPALNFSGTATITYTISDPTGLSSTATASVNVGANTAPTGADKLININEDDAYTFTANDFGFADADLAQTLSSVRIDSLPTAGSLTLAGVAVTLGQVIPVASLGNLIFSPVANAYGNNYANFTFSVQDSAGAFDNLPNTIQFDVSAVNDTPIISTPIPDQNALEDALFSFQFSANTFTDADPGDTLTYAAQLGGGGALPSWLSFDAATRTFSGTPGNDDVGSISIEVISSDGTTSVSHRFNVIVGGVNDAPVNTVPSAITMDEDTVQAITGLSVNDIDAGSSIINVTLQITNGILNVTGGSANIAGSGSNTVTLTGTQSEINSTLAATVNYIPALNFTGTSTFTITTNDNGNSGIGGALVDADTVLITVNPVNDAPVLQGESFSVNEDSYVSGNLLANDIDVDSSLTIGSFNWDGITYASGSTAILNGVGSLLINADGSFTFTPLINYVGPVPVVSYLVQEDGVNFGSSNLNLSILPANDAPVISAGTKFVTGSEDSAYIFSWAEFGVSDVDLLDSLHIRITSLPADGQLQIFDGSLWVAVALNQDISKTIIDAGSFRFMPDFNESGSAAYGNTGVGNMQSNYAYFNYQGFDGTTTSSTATMVIDIVPVVDDADITWDGNPIIDGSVVVPLPPISEGLTVRVYSNLVGVNPSNVDTEAGVSALLELLDAEVPVSNSISSNPQNYVEGSGDPSGIATDGAYRITGLIYLEGGKNYTFSSYMDDSSVLRLGGIELMNERFNSWGIKTAGTFVAPADGYYSLDWAVYNGDGIGAFKPWLSVNSGPALEFNAANFKLYGSVTSLEAAGGIHDDFVPTGAGGFFPVTSFGVEDSFIKLAPIAVTLIDTDGSEILASIHTRNLLVGSILTDGVNSFTATSLSTSADITSWNLSSLQLRAPENFNGNYTLNIEAVTREIATGQESTSARSIIFEVAAINDVPIARADNINLIEDVVTTYSGNLLANDEDVDLDLLTLQSVNGITVNSNTNIQGAFGLLLVQPDGNYIYSMNANSAQINALKGGEFVRDIFTYQIMDPSGATSRSSLIVTIEGTSDAVTITGSSSDDNLLGTSGDDVIQALGGNDFIAAGAGHDVIYLGRSNPGSKSIADILSDPLMTQAEGSVSMTSANGTTLVLGDSGNDAIIGAGGVDLAYGGKGDDYLFGGASSDGLRGGTGNDRIEGGSGSDVMRGDLGRDVFIWKLNDQANTPGSLDAGAANPFELNTIIKITPDATDLIMDFNKSEGDVLDLRDLLQGESHLGIDPGNLADYLHFETTLINGVQSTVVHVSSTGNFASGYDAAQEDMTIVLSNVNLGVDNTGVNFLDDRAIIQDLLTNNRLITD